MRVHDAGYAVVTDLGRFAGPATGLSVNGALDQHAARTANHLVGNPAGAPLIELTISTLTIQLDRDALIAVSGAPASVEVDGVAAGMHTPVVVARGGTVRVTVGDRGLRSYIAIRGSLDVPMLLGSCAPDTMIGFGLRLTPGTEVRELVSTPMPGNPFFGVPFFPPGDRPRPLDEEPSVPVTDGPDVHEFGDSASGLFAQPYEVSPRSNHVGLRLSGPTPQRMSADEVLSRGVPVGAIEVPSCSELLVLHRGRGVTAGYPVLGVVTTVGLDVMAQVRPGQRVRFRRITLREASFLRLEQHVAEERFRRRCGEFLRLNGVPDLDPPVAPVRPAPGRAADGAPRSRPLSHARPAPIHEGVLS